MLCKCSVAVPPGAVGWSAVCDCVIFWSYSLTFVCDTMSYYGEYLRYVIWKSSNLFENRPHIFKIPKQYPFDLGLWPWPWPWRYIPDFMFVTYCLVMVDTFAKWYENLTKAVEVVPGKRLCLLTLACDLDLWHTVLCHKIHGLGMVETCGRSYENQAKGVDVMCIWCTVDGQHPTSNQYT